ncbi:MAG: protein kinase, partial [Trueperella pyogenes]|nr:protein kinase [Trueperella pyogenes]
MNIGGYEIGQVFHIGSTGPLWKTRTEAGDALVALRSPSEGERCLSRWKSWASITSRHVVALRDVVRSDDGRWAIVHDYVPGRSLDAELGSPDLRPIATRRQILHGIAAGVSALHGAGIAHGDLTPANIIITPEGRAVIIDLIDEIGDGEGTPGWSLEATGREADRRCLRQIASLLDMNEELATLGID